MKSLIDNVLLPTTVVGSYPVVAKRSIRSLFDPLKSAVEYAVSRQLSAGIDLISDGQVRCDMIEAFASKLPGIRGKEIIGPVKPADFPITVQDTKYALSRHKHVKGIITGPSTLSYALHINTKMYRSKDELIPDIAAALKKEVNGLVNAGVTMLQIDEPIFSTGVADLSVGRDAIETIAKDLPIPVCMHICGSISNIMDEFISMPVQVLDFEGTKDPANLPSFSGKELSNRYIGFGCVDSGSDEVESVEIIVKRIYEALEIFNPEQILLDPDCGLRMLEDEVAYAKLSNLVTAAAEVRKEL